ncbi:PepSY domain-containing protein [Rhizobium glycinendophyticum]|uniref:PepSY domain-containing protein n=1 Tax=Rhizobium glycinendophyticum TaxID=2589807 RepID=A0A504U3F2_9HYPH|nr:hypothetical protein [Rhizobium glycinendophyticum]TPP09524.1 hypothetical protein FJQ55_01210 [Rhizobium glycinendophyticum]
MDRRRFLLMLLSSTFVTALAPAPDAAAKSGSGGSGNGSSGNNGGGSGNGSSGSGGSGSGNGGNDNSGSGSGSSGGDDDSGDDDDNDGDDDGEDSAGDDSPGGLSSSPDHQRARDAVGRGRIRPLREILQQVEDTHQGRVIAVNLNLDARNPFYTLKVQSGAKVRTLKFDAATGRRLNLFGW